jgi:uncharacterized membrane protein
MTHPFSRVILSLFILILTSFNSLILDTPQWPLILVGAAGGFIGSLIDSLLGEVLQYSGII